MPRTPGRYEIVADAALVALASDGDPAALDALAGRHVAAAYALAAAILTDDGVAADVTVAAFVALWREPARYTTPGADLLAAVHRQAVERVRGDERLRRLRTAADLPDGMPAVLGLAYLGAFTQPEVAALTGSTADAVREATLAGLRRPEGGRDEHVGWDLLAAGHALDALEPGDEQAYADHRRGCSRCRRDEPALREAAAALGRTVDPVAPPPGLTGRIRAAALAARPAVDKAVRRRAAPAGTARHRLPTVPIAAALAVVLVLLLGAWNVTLRGEAQARRAAVTRRDAALACYAGPGAVRYDLAVGGACLADEQVYLVTDSLDPGLDYVLWWQDTDRKFHLVGRFAVERAGRAVFALPLLAVSANVHALEISRESGRELPDQPTRRVAYGTRAP